MPAEMVQAHFARPEELLGVSSAHGPTFGIWLLQNLQTHLHLLVSDQLSNIP